MASCLDQMAGVTRVALRSLLPPPQHDDKSQRSGDPGGEELPKQQEAAEQALPPQVAAAAEMQPPSQHLAIEMGQARLTLPPVRTGPQRGSSSSLDPGPQQASPLSPLGSVGGTCRRRRSSSVEGSGMRPAGSSPVHLQRLRVDGVRGVSQEATLQRSLSDVSARSVYAVRRDPTFKVCLSLGPLLLQPGVV